MIGVRLTNLKVWLPFLEGFAVTDVGCPKFTVLYTDLISEQQLISAYSEKTNDS